MNAFYLLCVTVSLAVFFLGAGVGLVVANAAAWLIGHFDWQSRLLRLPALLFSIRMLPLTLGAALTFGFALPSFLLLEPTKSVETPEPYLIALATFALAALGFLALRCGRLMSASNKTLRRWLYRAELLPTATSPAVYRIESPESLIAVTGIFRPRVLIGRAALSTLSGKEFEAAVAHEWAHARALDNLKQLLLKITRLPAFFSSLASIDAAWSSAVELRADAAALRLGTSPLELSSAIVKIGRLQLVSREALSVAACHLIPPGGSSALAMRLEHLEAALAENPASARPGPHRPRMLALLAVAIAYLLILPSALPLAHRWMEWLVR